MLLPTPNVSDACHTLCGGAHLSNNLLHLGAPARLGRLVQQVLGHRLRQPARPKEGPAKEDAPKAPAVKHRHAKYITSPAILTRAPKALRKHPLGQGGRPNPTIQPLAAITGTTAAVQNGKVGPGNSPQRIQNRRNCQPLTPPPVQPTQIPTRTHSFSLAR